MLKSILGVIAQDFEGYNVILLTRLDVYNSNKIYSEIIFFLYES